MAEEAETFSEPETVYHALRNGRLTYQRCKACQHAWLPERTECPNCLQCDIDRLPASGAARLISWVVFHRAYVPAFKDRVPYTVAIVELEEGPRLISNIVEVDDPERLTIDQALRLQIARQCSAQVPVFAPAHNSQTANAQG